MPASGSRPLRLVLDTNIVVAGLLWNGPPRRLIDLSIEGEAVAKLRISLPHVIVQALARESPTTCTCRRRRPEFGGADTADVAGCVRKLRASRFDDDGSGHGDA